MRPSVIERIGTFTVGIVPTEAVGQFWPDVEEGFLRAVENSPGDVDLDSLSDALQEGNCHLLILAGPDGPEGAAVIEDIVSVRGNWLNLPFLWSSGLVQLSRIFSFVEEYAQANGYIGVKWVTNNSRAPVLAKRKGYAQRLVEYVKEF